MKALSRTWTENSRAELQIQNNYQHIITKRTKTLSIHRGMIGFILPHPVHTILNILLLFSRRDNAIHLLFLFRGEGGLLATGVLIHGAKRVCFGQTRSVFVSAECLLSRWIIVDSEWMLIALRQRGNAIVLIV